MDMLRLPSGYSHDYREGVLVLPRKWFAYGMLPSFLSEGPARKAIMRELVRSLCRASEQSATGQIHKDGMPLLVPQEVNVDKITTG